DGAHDPVVGGAGRLGRLRPAAVDDGGDADRLAQEDPDEAGDQGDDAVVVVARAGGWAAVVGGGALVGRRGALGGPGVVAGGRAVRGRGGVGGSRGAVRVLGAVGSGGAHRGPPGQVRAARCGCRAGRLRSTAKATIPARAAAARAPRTRGDGRGTGPL